MFWQQTDEFRLAAWRHFEAFVEVLACRGETSLAMVPNGDVLLRWQERSGASIELRCTPDYLLECPPQATAERLRQIDFAQPVHVRARLNGAPV